MVNAIAKMHNLQELVRKVNLGGLIDNAVILFKDNRMKIEAIGTEDEEGIIDNTLTIDVDYPCEVVEAGEVGINHLGNFLANLELFERDDVVQISVYQNILTIVRASQPPQTLTFEVADTKYIKTYSTGLKVIFGTPIKLVLLNGETKLMTFDSSAIVDAQKLKEHASKVAKIDVKYVPISIKDGKLITDVRGETSGLIREVDGVTAIVGKASSLYDKELLTILRLGIGTATLKFSENAPLHIHFEHESMTADYLLQIHDEK